MQRPPLPQSFLHAPIAHRALHDRAAGRPENSREAIAAAVAAGYGIEIDLQPSSDGVAMVFHDNTLDRLTGDTGPIKGRSAADLATTLLNDGPSGIPTFAEALEIVAGRVPLLVEIKDQDGQMGDAIGALEAAAAETARGYDGPLAFMSFNPHSVARMAELMPDTPRGLITAAYDPRDWTMLSPETCARLAAIPDMERTGASFISHHAPDLGRARVREIAQQGWPVLCWTIRSAAAEADARQLADNVTFEGYAAAIPA
ncbi:phosphodiesterase [Pseudooceanicola sediminis]|uniref:Phosphodiesterase n=1 Tax=Pseudooceanicola sediminis TaxID=2211117 RepID=A0A399J0Z7_9RHOB|nr:glycerophosphodiester phosphodiesterase family protein [Pseudooceanicola sediminis]KAA2312544.1 phosphodiesterase [Puniceibacterium sp. HSS470]RII37552.1 phosphodiesterase [Pseudooceanicola sediminis]|tara:strand:+ start:41059 stop:41832 length:774 start_codon:yes stop_codon:yes gene_type:complete